jgi:PAS domain-containing protein
VGDARHILHIAHRVLDQYGEDAEPLMASRAKDCEADGDAQAALVWKRVARVLRILRRGRLKRQYFRRPSPKSSPTGLTDAEIRAAFWATPHPYLLIKPSLEIAEANDAFLKATLKQRGDVIGCELFEVFPEHPDRPDSHAVAHLMASLARVIDSGRPDRMPVQRYDLSRPDGGYEERWWELYNVPTFDEDGKLLLIVHYVEDVTLRVTGARD